MDIILCDIDHTVADSGWRDTMIGGPGGWDAYHAASWEDKPVKLVVDLLDQLSRTYNIIGLTARPNKWRQLTTRWLIAHSIPFDETLMRHDTDFHPAPELKLKLVKERFGADFATKIAFVIDDRDDVAAAFKGLGVHVLQSHIGKRS